MTKAYEILSDDHKRAIYDEESISDQEFFTISIGPLRINLFLVFGLTFFGAIGSLIYVKMMKKGEKPCPIDMGHKSMARDHYKEHKFQK